MILLKNGHKLDFLCASGALAWYGEGYWWEKPLKWLGLICPEELTIISKTLTFTQRQGNLNMWCPWCCVRLIPPESVVNAVGLSNPGYKWWIKNSYRIGNFKVIVSIMPQSVEEAIIMVKELNACPIVGYELNYSCPNVGYNCSIYEIVDAIISNTNLPLIVKLGYHDPYVEICKKLEGKVDAFDLINSVPWGIIYDKPSPLARYNLVGAVSGDLITKYAREALVNVKGIKTPIISGGGILSEDEVYVREDLGAKAFSFGTAFLRKPWIVKNIIRNYRKNVEVL